MENEVVIPIAENITGTYISSLGQYISNIVSVFIMIAAVAAFIFLVWGGLEWILAGGDKGKIESARNRITGALIGLAIVAASWAIFLLVDYFFGLGMAGGTGTSSSNPSGGNGSNQGVCLYPTSRCCSDISNSACFCQNPNYQAATYGSCDGGGGTTGVLCGCEPR